MERADLDVAVALDVQADVLRVVDITEDEFLAEFARVMHKWGPALGGLPEVRYPTLPEARRALDRRLSR